MSSDSDAPYCHSCGHFHVQGVKCSICGHVGKSQIFPKMRMKANERRKIRVSLLDGLRMDMDPSQFDIIFEFRASVSPTEFCGATHCVEFDALENSSYHIMMSVGDAIAAVGRMRLVNNGIAGCDGLLIDKFFVSFAYRRMSIAYHCLHTVIQNAKTSAISKISFLSFYAQSNSWLAASCLSQGFVASDMNGQPLAPDSVGSLAPTIITLSFDLSDPARVEQVLAYLAGKLKAPTNAIIHT